MSIHNRKTTMQFVKVTRSFHRLHPAIKYYKLKTSPTGRKRACLSLHSGITESRDVDSHVSGTDADSRDT